MNAILLSKDLLFITKVKEAAASSGSLLTVAKSVEALRDALGASPSGGVVMIDLEKTPLSLEVIRDTLASVENSAWRVCGFFSHVHVEVAEMARQAGIHEVMPRSKFVSILPNLLSSLV